MVVDQAEGVSQANSAVEVGDCLRNQVAAEVGDDGRIDTVLDVELRQGAGGKLGGVNDDHIARVVAVDIRRRDLDVFAAHGLAQCVGYARRTLWYRACHTEGAHLADDTEWDPVPHAFVVYLVEEGLGGAGGCGLSGLSGLVGVHVVQRVEGGAQGVQVHECIDERAS